MLVVMAKLITMLCSQFVIHVGKKLVGLHEHGWVHRDLKVRFIWHWFHIAQLYSRVRSC